MEAQIVHVAIQESRNPARKQGVCNRCATVWKGAVDELCGLPSQTIPTFIHAEKKPITNQLQSLTKIHPQSTGVKKKMTVKLKT